MRQFALAVLILLSTTNCSLLSQHEATSRLALGDPLVAHGLTGTLVVHDAARDLWFSNDYDRAEKRFSPASTFKIPHALIALETGAISGPDEIMKWDGTDRGWSKWNQDHTLPSAIEFSVVWFFQETARRIGKAEMARQVDAFGYGNRKIGENVDQFWLNGDMSISALEQITFLQRFDGGSLPVSPDSLKTVKNALVLREAEGVVICGKTGWATSPDPDIGWLVGFMTCDAGTFYYALNMDIREDGDLKLRKEIVFDSLPPFCES